MNQSSPSAVLELYMLYRTAGIRKGSEFLFPPVIARRFIKEGADRGFVCLGVTLWYRPPNLPQYLAEDWWTNIHVPDHILVEPNVATTSAALLDQRMTERLQPHHAYIGVWFHTPQIDWRALAAAWDALPGPTYPLPVEDAPHDSP